MRDDARPAPARGMAGGAARLKVGDVVEVFAIIFNAHGVAEKKTWSFLTYGAQHKTAKQRGAITQNLANVGPARYGLPRHPPRC